MASRQRRSAGRVRTGGSPQRRVEHRSPVRAHAHGNGSARHMSRSPVASGARAHAAPGHPGLVPQPSHSSVMSATSAVTAGSVMSVPGHGGSTGGMRPHMVQAGGPHGMPGAMMHPGVPHPMASPMAPPGAAPNGGSMHVRVIVRVRPLNSNERTRGYNEVTHITPDAQGLQLVTQAGKGRELVKKYRFGMCLGPSTSQAAFFAMSGIQSLVDSAISGYSACCFAYGQTGSGKTYTVSGLEERIARDEWSHHGDAATDGLIPRAVQYMYQSLARRTAEQRTKFTVRCSFCEIYNEKVYDLLHPSSSTLPVRWNKEHGFFVQGLMVLDCSSLADIMAIVSEGHRNRRTGSHELNLDSSRSHSILSINVEAETSDPDDGHSVVTHGKMLFVDLAGSERLKESKSEGLAAVETGSINKSLFILGKVISMLGDSKRRTGHVPYRDSKLTKLLMDCLGGSSFTLMVACCSPSEHHLEETLNTLNYATRASNIKNKPVVHIDAQEQLIFNLRQEIKLLRMENEYLRAQLGGVAQGQFPLPRLWGQPGTATPTAGGGQYLQPYLPHAAYSPMAVGGAGAAPSGAGTPVARLPPLGAGGSPRNAGGSQRPVSADEAPTPEPPAGGAPRGRGRNSRSRGSYSKRSASAGSGAVKAQSGTPTSLAGGLRAETGSATLDRMSENERRALAKNTAVNAVLQEYQAEIARLRREQHAQRSRESKLEREFEDLMQENEKLGDKLEQLEDAFVHGGDADAQWPVAGGPPRGAGAGGADGGGKEAAAGSGAGQGTGEGETKAAAAAPTATEERLKAALRKVADDNNALREELAALQEAAARSGGGAAGGGDPDDREVRLEEQRAMYALKQENTQLQQRVRTLLERERQLTAALEEVHGTQAGSG